MRRAATATLLIAVALLLAGCSVSQPSYTEVRDEALNALGTVVGLMPEGSVATPRAEQKPYSCKDPLMGNGADGAFHTAYWEVEVPPTMDIPAFIDELPDRLGNGWRAETLGVTSANPQVYLIHDGPSLSVTVEQSRREGPTGIDLIAISRCGTLADQDRSLGTSEPPRFDPLG